MSQDNKRTINGLQEEINNIQLPPHMNFSGIASKLRLPTRNRLLLKRLQSPLLFTSGVLGLLLILFAMTKSFQWQWVIEPGSPIFQRQKSGILPILSTLLFLLPPFFSADEVSQEPHNNLFVILITIVLWLGQGLVWMFVFLNLTELTIWLVYLLSRNLDIALLTKIVFVFFIALVWLSLMIFNGEYHFKHLGQPNSWKSFGRTLIISGILYSISILMLQL